MVNAGNCRGNVLEVMWSLESTNQNFKEGNILWNNSGCGSVNKVKKYEEGRRFECIKVLR